MSVELWVHIGTDGDDWLRRPTKFSQEAYVIFMAQHTRWGGGSPGAILQVVLFLVGADRKLWPRAQWSTKPCMSPEPCVPGCVRNNDAASKA